MECHNFFVSFCSGVSKCSWVKERQQWSHLSWSCSLRTPIGRNLLRNCNCLEKGKPVHSRRLTPGKLTWQWKMDPLKMYFLLQMGIFYCHVSFLECNFYCHLVSIAWNLKKAPILEKAKCRHKLKPPILGFHVSFRGCIKPPCVRICLFYFSYTT